MLQDQLIKLLVTVNDFDFALYLDNLKIDYLLIGYQDLSCLFNHYFTYQEIKQISKQIKYSKLVICLNNIYSELDLDLLTQTLKQLDQIKNITIMFADFAVCQIAYENNLQLNLFYNPSTLVTSYGQFDFYWQNNIKQVNLATELTLSEIKKICENKQKMFVSIKGFGLGFVMYSRWKMIKTFSEYSQINKQVFDQVNYLLIKEEERKYPNIIYEDKFGTYMLTGYYICCLKQINELKQMQIDGLIIDLLFVDQKLAKLVIEFYIKAIKNNSNQKALISYYNKIQKTSKLTISPGFFGDHNLVLHTIKEDEKQ